MADVYSYERSSVAASGANWQTLVSAPPEGVSYRIFYVNAYNNAGSTRTAIGAITDTTTGTRYGAFQAVAADANCFLPHYATFALAEYPTIAVLDSTDQIFEISLTDILGSMVFTACYEIVDQSGPRTFRNSLVTMNGTSFVELLPAPTEEVVYRIISLNGRNGSGGTRILWGQITSATGVSRQRVLQMTAVNGNSFHMHTSTFESPFPEIVLSAANTDNLRGYLNGTGTFGVVVNYEVHSRLPT
jgi:hypothetical protein